MLGSMEIRGVCDLKPAKGLFTDPISDIGNRNWIYHCCVTTLHLSKRLY